MAQSHDAKRDAEAERHAINDASIESTQHRWLRSQHDVAPAIQSMITNAQREVCCADINLSIFGLASLQVIGRLHDLLLGHLMARVHLLVDATDWLDTSAPRLRSLQMRLPHAIKIRQSQADNPVGEDGVVIVDGKHLIQLRKTRYGIGEMWQHHPAQAHIARRTFERRWESAAHDLAAKPLGL